KRRVVPGASQSAPPQLPVRPEAPFAYDCLILRDPGAGATRAPSRRRSPRPAARHDAARRPPCAPCAMRQRLPTSVWPLLSGGYASNPALSHRTVTPPSPATTSPNYIRSKTQPRAAGHVTLPPAATYVSVAGASLCSVYGVTLMVMVGLPVLASREL